MTGETLLVGRYFLWRALGNNFAAAFASFRTKVDDPVGGFDYIQVVLITITVFPWSTSRCKTSSNRSMS